MSIIVRVYEAVDNPPPNQRFYARAIAMKSAAGKPDYEGFSVGFYADDVEAARAKAYAWIESERQRQAKLGARNDLAASRRTAKAEAGR